MTDHEAEAAGLSDDLTFTIRPCVSSSGFNKGYWKATIMGTAERPSRYAVAKLPERALWRALCEFFNPPNASAFPPSERRGRKPSLDYYDGDDGIWHGGKVKGEFLAHHDAERFAH